MKNINELSDNAKFKAFQDFIKFAEHMGHDSSHSFDEFVETSNVNQWKYNDDGVFISE